MDELWDMDKRTFLKLTGAAGAAFAVAPAWACGQTRDLTGTAAAFDPFVLEPLGYAFDALAPDIDAATVELHYTKHHGGYVKNLNAEVEKRAEFHGISVDRICALVSSAPGDAVLRNNAGGHWNHTLYWKLLRPGGPAAPSEALRKAVEASFGSVDAMLAALTTAATKVFGSGWAWLVAKPDGTLAITTTANQDNPLMARALGEAATPLIGIDVWEHAYYLTYRNRRADYIASFVRRLNWDEVERAWGAAHSTR